MNARGRRTTAWDVTLDITISLGSRVALPVQSRAEAPRQGPRSGTVAPRAVPDGEVAGAPCRHRAADRRLDMGLQGLRRGRGTPHAHIRGPAGAAPERDHRRHPLCDPLEPLR